MAITIRIVSRDFHKNHLRFSPGAAVEPSNENIFDHTFFIFARKISKMISATRSQVGPMQIPKQFYNHLMKNIFPLNFIIFAQNIFIISKHCPARSRHCGNRMGSYFKQGVFSDRGLFGEVSCRRVIVSDRGPFG